MPDFKFAAPMKTFGVFLCFGAVMALLAAVTLTWPGTVLDVAWRLNPTAHQAMAPYGWRIGTEFFSLSGVLVISAIGWYRQRRWGWALSVLIIATQVAEDFVNLLRGEVLQGIVGSG